MEVNVDFDKYAKNVLIRLEKQLKNSKDDYEKEELKKDIERHKEKYFKDVNEDLYVNINTDLEELEKDYLKYFLEVIENNGLDGLVVACQNKDFAMYPFVEIIKKIVGLDEDF